MLFRGFAAFAFSCALVFGQGTTSRIAGTVEDPAHAAVADAQVKLTNEATRVGFTTATTSSGSYVFDAIQPGAYQVEVEAPGFKRYLSRNNVVTIGQPTTVNVRMELGGVAEQVTVTDAAELVQTSTSG